MDGIGIFGAVILGIVEGLTEFLPVSSTGHLILAGNMLSAHGEKAKLFEVFIQLGAIFAVMWIYRKKIFSSLIKFTSDEKARSLWLSVGVAFIPAAAVGFAVHKLIKQYLFGPVTVAIALVAGGLIILLIEKRKHSNKIGALEDITITAALAVGIAQVFALCPGVSRSGATIMGGLLAGMTRQASTEFSFFLAIPTMIAATMYDLSKSYSLLSSGDAQILLIGFAAAFISALWVVRWLIKFISNHDFKSFAYYRIIFGTALLAWYIYINK